MITTFLQFLPCFVSIALAAFFILNKNAQSNRYFLPMSIIGMFYYFGDAAYIASDNNYSELMSIDLMAQFFACSLAPMTMQFLHHESTGQNHSYKSIVLYLPSLMFGITNIICHSAIGEGNMNYLIRSIEKNGYTNIDGWSGFEKLYILNNLIVNRITMILFTVLLLIYVVILLHNRYKKKKDMSVTRRLLMSSVVCLIIFTITLSRPLLGRTTIIHAELFNCIYGISVSCAIGVLGFIYLRRFYLEREKDSGIINTENKEEDTTRFLKEKLIAYFREEKPYLDPNLSLNSVADHLCTNRTYMSMLFNRGFNKGFRTYVNEQRINYAKDYMKNNKGCSIAEIAEISGFTSASQFSRKFKEEEGVSPIAWMRKNC